MEHVGSTEELKLISKKLKLYKKLFDECAVILEATIELTSTLEKNLKKGD